MNEEPLCMMVDLGYGIGDEVGYHFILFTMVQSEMHAILQNLPHASLTFLSCKKFLHADMQHLKSLIGVDWGTRT